MREISTYIEESFYSNVKSNPLKELEDFWNSPERAIVKKHSGVKRLQDIKTLEHILDNIFISETTKLVFRDKYDPVSFRVVKASPDFIFNTEKRITTVKRYCSSTYEVATKMLRYYWESDVDTIYQDFKIEI